jgi:hypothetical protein
MPKAEISWKRVTEDGIKLQVNARRVGGRWYFYGRHARYDRWIAQEEPVLEDWLELLDAVRRMVPRRRYPPDEIERVEKAIRDRFPDADLSS